MSQRSKKNRQAKLPLPPQAAKGRSPRLAAVFVAAAIVLSLGIWWWKSRSVDIPSAAKALTEASAVNQTAAETKPDFQKLTGRWRRPDGGYVVEIKSVAPDGSMDAAYFNPKSIHVAKAEASRDADATRVFIELRDVNYPGRIIP